MTLLTRLRFAPLLAAAFVLLACGGGDPGTGPGPTPPPPPPPPPPPTLVSVAVAPDTLALEAVSRTGTLTATLAPSGATGTIVWRSANTAIATVSGSGTSATVTAIAPGSTQIVASVGAIEGSATVTVPPVPQEFETSIPASGGTLRVDIPGHPFDDFSIEVPPGSFSGSTEWRVSTDSTPGTFPAGVTALGPGLRIEGPTGLTQGGQMLTLRVPVSAAPSETVVIALVDGTTGAFDLLPLMGRDANSVTVMTRHLDASRFSRPAGSTGMRAARMRFAQSDIGAILMPIKVPAGLMQNVASSMNLNRHAWPVAEDGSANFPEGHGSAKAALSVSAALLDYDLQTLVRQQGNGWFYRDTAPLATVMITSLLQRQHEIALQAVRAIRPSVGSANGMMSSIADLPKASWDSLMATNILAAMALTGEPQLFLKLADVDDITDRGKHAWAVAVAAENGVIRFLDPVHPGSTRALPLTSNGFADVASKSLVSDAAATNRSFVMSVPTALMDLTASRQQLMAMETALRASGTEREALNQALWEQTNSRVFEVQSRRTEVAAYSTIDGPVVVRDSVASIKLSGAGSADLSLRFYEPGSDTEALRSAGGASVLIEDLPGVKDAEPGEKVVVEGVVVEEDTDHQVAPLRFEVTKAQFRIVRDTVDLRDSSYFVWKVDLTEPPDEGYRIEWNWGDGTEPTVKLNDTAADHQFTRVDTFVVTARLMSLDDPAVELARDSAVAFTGPLPFWQLTSISDPTNFLGEGDVGSYPQVREILNSPNRGLIAYSENTSNDKKGLTLWRMTTTQFPPCCRRSVRAIGGLMSGGAIGVGLGELPEKTWPLGPAFAGFEKTGWWHSTTDLNAGTMTSTGYTFTSMNHTVRGGPQMGPGGPAVWRLNATRNGDIMTGTISLYRFKERDDDGYMINPGVPTYVFPFTAKRLM